LVLIICGEFFLFGLPGLNQKKTMAYLKNQRTQKTWFEKKSKAKQKNCFLF
jgi:hypothetical protein